MIKNVLLLHKWRSSNSPLFLSISLPHVLVHKWSDVSDIIRNMNVGICNVFDESKSLQYAQVHLFIQVFWIIGPLFLAPVNPIIHLSGEVQFMQFIRFIQFVKSDSTSNKHLHPIFLSIIEFQELLLSVFNNKNSNLNNSNHNSNNNNNSDNNNNNNSNSGKPNDLKDCIRE